MSAADLRDRIKAALRARHGAHGVRVWVWRTQHDPEQHCAACSIPGWRTAPTMAPYTTGLDALTALAAAVGLNADGSDPRAEVDRLTRELDAAIADAAQLRDVMRRQIAGTDHHGNCPMYGTTDDADPRCTCVVGALYHALEGGAR